MQLFLCLQASQNPQFKSKSKEDGFKKPFHLQEVFILSNSTIS
jgi:hypothetical protein